MPRGYNCKRNKQSPLGSSIIPWGYPVPVPGARAAHPANPRGRRPGSPGVHAGEHPPGSPGLQRCLGFWGKGDAGQAKTGTIKAKGEVSKLLPFSEIFLSDLFNSTGSG